MARYLVVIPAKYCSKRLPHKNMSKIGSKTLVELTVDYAKTSRNNVDIVVSTDHNEIETFVNKHNICKCISRGDRLSGETDVVEVYIDAWKQQGCKADYIIGLQPDHPNRTIMLDDAISYAEHNNVDDFFTVDRNGKKNGSIRILRCPPRPYANIKTMCDDCINIHTPRDLEKARKVMLGQAIKCKLIAEIGWGHGGDMTLAKEMIQAAKESGADYAKFQTWKENKLKSGPWDLDGRRYLYKKAELSETDHFTLKEFCGKVDIKFLTSCFCIDDLSFVRQLTPEIKIPSPECFEKEFVHKACSLFENLFISTGAASSSEYDYLVSYENVVLLHCVSSYPCRSEHFHWNKLMHIKSLTDNFGYSGHSPTIWDAITAISFGAKVVEKHFTIDHNLPGRDHRFALLPEEFKQIYDYSCSFDLMKQKYPINEILECEQEYRKYHKSRWG